MTESRDLHTLRVLLSDFFTPSIMEDKYTIPGKEAYQLPPDGGVAIDSYITQLPSSDEAEVLGFNDNMKQYCSRLEAHKFFDALTNVFHSPVKRDVIAVIDEIERQLPKEELFTQHKDLVREGILGAILKQEVGITKDCVPFAMNLIFDQNCKSNAIFCAYFRGFIECSSWKDQKFTSVTETKTRQGIFIAR